MEESYIVRIYRDTDNTSIFDTQRRFVGSVEYVSTGVQEVFHNQQELLHLLVTDWDDRVKRNETLTMSKSMSPKKG